MSERSGARQPAKRPVGWFILAALIGAFVGGLTVHIAEHNHRPPDLGDVPTWVGAVGAVFAGLVALQQLQKVNTNQEKLIDLQLAAEVTRSIAQVKLMIDSQETLPGVWLGLFVNRSSTTVRDVVIRRFLSATDFQDVARIGGNTDGSSVIEPGGVVSFRVELPAQSAGSLPPGHPARAFPEWVAHFTDMNGGTWEVRPGREPVPVPGPRDW